MKAVWIERFEGASGLHLRDVPKPEPGLGKVRIRVAAAGLNRADLLQARGLYPAPAGAPERIPGLEVAGEIDAVGADVGEWRVGDRAMAVVAGGGMAEWICVPSRELLRVPECLAFEEAAAVPEAFATAWDALFLQAGVALGDTAIVHAVGSGVGTAALQLLKAAGARVIGTSRQISKLGAAEALGLDVGVLAGDGLWDRISKEAPEGVAAVLDLVGGAGVAAGLRVLRTGGTIMVVGLVAGAAVQLPLGLLMQKRARVVGTVLRSRNPEEKAALAQALGRGLIPLLDRREVRPVVGAVLGMSQVQEGHALLEASEVFGKVVLQW